MAVLRPRLGLACHDLTVKLGGRVVLDAVSLTVDRPGVTALIGPNGAGKSTLLAALAGLVPASLGRVERLPVGKIKPVITSIGMLQQRPVLLRRSVEANLEYAMAAAGIARSAWRQRSSTVLHRMGLEAMRHRPARGLSLGEQQRLALARIEVMEPGILLFDEATTALDPASAQLIEQRVSSLAADGMPVVWVTHDLGQLQRLADHVVLLHRGRIDCSTPIAGFFSQPPTPFAAAFLAGHGAG